MYYQLDEESNKINVYTKDGIYLYTLDTIEEVVSILQSLTDKIDELYEEIERIKL